MEVEEAGDDFCESASYESDYEYEFDVESNDSESECSTTSGSNEGTTESHCAGRTKPKLTIQPSESSIKLLPCEFGGVRWNLASSATNNKSGGLNYHYPSRCRLCQEECHMPITSCSLAASWVQRGKDEGSSIITLEPGFLLPTFRQRIRECSLKLGRTDEEALAIMRRQRWNDTELANVDWKPDNVIANQAYYQENVGQDDILVEQRRFLGTIQNQMEQEHRLFLRQTMPTGSVISAVKLNEEANINPKYCAICRDDEAENMFGMKCNHPYCQSCWVFYLQTKFEGNYGGQNLEAECPDPDCNEVISEDFVGRVAPLLLPKYNNHQICDFINGHRDVMRWCPGPECDRVAVKARDGIFIEGSRAVFCRGGCQTRFCFDCGLDPHEGECELPVLLRESTASPIGPRVPNIEARHQRALFKGRDNRIRLCPNCKTPIEKNGGCNHITCKCGTHFCWLCKADITKNPYRHYCGREQDRPSVRRTDDREQLASSSSTPTSTLPPVNLDYVANVTLNGISWENSWPSREKMEALKRDIKNLEKFAHYYNRFAAHNQSQCFAEGQIECVQGRADTFSKLIDIKSAAESDFYAIANDRIVQCRRTLKYSYCYIYQKLIEKEQEKDDNCLGLFQMQLERLETMTEQLSEISERALTHADRRSVVDLIEVVDRCMMNIINFELNDTYIGITTHKRPRGIS